MKNNTTITSWLFTPFKYIAGLKALIFGFTIILILSVMGYFGNTHFDGALDIHYGCGENTTPYTIHIFYQFVKWISFITIFYIAGRIVTKSKIRIVDIAGTVALSQAPLILAALAGFIPMFHICIGDPDSVNIAATIATLKENIVPLFIVGIITIGVSIWSILLMYNGYSISVNIKGIIGVVSFVIALFVAEVISLITLHFLIPILF